MFTLLSANIATCHMPLEIYPPPPLFFASKAVYHTEFHTLLVLCSKYGAQFSKKRLKYEFPIFITLP